MSQKSLTSLSFQVAITIIFLPLVLLYNLFCYYFKGEKQKIEHYKNNIFLLTRQIIEDEFPKNINVDHKIINLKEKTIRLHVVTAGPENGELVIMLHGYPDIWYSWKYQIIALASAGYRVVAPDMRGYNLSDKPKGISNYKVYELYSDISALINVFNRSKAHILGHDWGGVVAQYVAMFHPEKVDKLVFLNAPHPSLHFKAMTTNPRQFLMSWYIFMHLFPLIPELLFLNAIRMYQAFMPRINDTYQQLLVASAAQQYAATARANYYRAIVWCPPPKENVINNDTLLIWGTRDKFLLGETADPERLRKHRIPNITHKTVDASHFLLHEKPDEINQYILEFLK